MRVFSNQINGYNLSTASTLAEVHKIQTTNNYSSTLRTLQRSQISASHQRLLHQHSHADIQGQLPILAGDGWAGGTGGGGWWTPIRELFWSSHQWATSWNICCPIIHHQMSRKTSRQGDGLSGEGCVTRWILKKGVWILKIRFLINQYPTCSRWQFGGKKTRKFLWNYLVKCYSAFGVFLPF